MSDASDMPSISGWPLQRYRNYLRVLARMSMGERYRGKIDASDVVQESMLTAFRKRGQFRGQTEAELMAWLRQILSTHVTDAVRAIHKQKRDVNREQPIEQAMARSMDASSSRLQDWLLADQSSPSCRLRAEERLLILVEALEQLPDTQRQAILLRHAQGMPLAEIARVMEKTTTAVAGLIKRGIKHMRETLDLVALGGGDDTSRT